MTRFENPYPPLDQVLGSTEVELLHLRAHLAEHSGRGPRRDLVITDRRWYQLYSGCVQDSYGWEEIHGLHWQRLWNRALLIVRMADPVPPYDNLRRGWTHRYRLSGSELSKLLTMLKLRLGNPGVTGDWKHGLPVERPVPEASLVRVPAPPASR